MRDLIKGLTLASILLLKSQDSKPSKEDLSINVLGQVYSYSGKDQKEKAEHLLQIAMAIQQNHGREPYVHGGDGFEDPKDQKRKYAKYKCFTEAQPSNNWRAGKPTIPGVDSTGLEFQILLEMEDLDKKSQINKGVPPDRVVAHFNYGRLDIKGYSSVFNQVVAPKEGNEEEIIQKARPGDFVVFYSKGNPVHNAFYLGNGRFLESAEKRTNISEIPEDKLRKWRKTMRLDNNKKDEAYGGIQLGSLKDYSKTQAAVYRLPELIDKK